MGALEHLDASLSETLVDLRWGPLTQLMLLMSAWWVKDLLAIAAGAVLARGRERLRTVATIAGATILGSSAANLLKLAVERPRPFAQGLWPALGKLPASTSMPSGHAATATAAAVALGLLHPRARLPAAGAAGLVCLSRVYLGVHFVSDVVAGALLGALAAVLVVRARRGDAS